MTLPASATKVHLDAATDDPKQARPELADLVDKFNALLTHLNLSTITSGPAAIPLSVANGGTGASTESAARTNLGVADATESAAGRIEIATQTEANNGTDDTRALTPAKLANISPASVTFAASDQVLILDASDSNKLKRATITSGKVLQQIYSSTAAYATGTTTIPFDDTIPQNTEGTEFMTATITPGNTNNLLVIEVQALVSLTNAVRVITALFQDATANALAATVWSNTGAVAAVRTGTLTLRYRMTAGTTSATTFKVRIGGDAASTLHFNGDQNTSARVFGGVSVSSITITEIAA
jgi:hypothetical protein